MVDRTWPRASCRQHGLVKVAMRSFVQLVDGNVSILDCQFAFFTDHSFIYQRIRRRLVVSCCPCSEGIAVGYLLSLVSFGISSVSDPITIGRLVLPFPTSQAPES